MQQRLEDQCQQMYENKLVAGRKSALYKNLVNSLSLQACLIKPIPFQYRQAIAANLRLSSHWLATETGRYTNTSISQHLCLYVKWTLKTNIT